MLTADARWRAVDPALVLALTLAPARSSAAARSAAPAPTAAWSGVRPCASLASAFAPSSSRTLAASEFCDKAACWGKGFFFCCPGSSGY